MKYQQNWRTSILSRLLQALALGAAKGDIAYDWPKGFFKRV